MDKGCGSGLLREGQQASWLIDKAGKQHGCAGPPSHHAAMTANGGAQAAPCAFVIERVSKAALADREASRQVKGHRFEP